MDKQKLGGLDWFRLAAAIMVIAIHTAPLAGISLAADHIFTYTLARVGVPFFFMVTGYFVLSAEQPNILKLLKKTGILYLAATVVYLPVSIYAGSFSDRGITGIIQDILFNGTFYHLWYLPALMLGAIIVFAMLKVMDINKVLVISVILYVIGIFGDSYYGIVEKVPGIGAFYKGLFNIFEYTRNGFFYAPIFLILGVLLRRNRNYKSSYTTATYAIGLGISTALMLIESMLLFTFEVQRHDSMYLLLIPVMYFLFNLLLNIEAAPAPCLRDLSMYVYIVHPMVIVLVRGAAKAVKLQKLLVDNLLVHFIAVAIGSVVISMIIVKLKNYLRHSLRSKKVSASIQPDGQSMPKQEGNQKARAWAEIKLSNLAYNIDAIDTLTPEGTDIIAIVKANAYGHGDIRVAKALQQAGMHNYAVATIDEAISLRRNGIKGDILILGLTHPKDFPQLKKYNLIQTVIDSTYARMLDHYQQDIRVHVKIDTGMNRLGEKWFNQSQILKIYQHNYLKVEGTFTHLGTADGQDLAARQFAELQINRFYETIEFLRENEIDPGRLHIQSSYGIMNYPTLKCDFVRPGIAMYGAFSANRGEAANPFILKPVMTIRSRVAITKTVRKGETIGYGLDTTAETDMKIAVVSIGYADGIPRTFKNGQVIIKGQKASVVGRVCMDMLMVDIIDLPPVKPGTVVTLIGEDGGQCIYAEEMAECSGTITNELFSRLGDRLKRVYVQ